MEMEKAKIIEEEEESPFQKDMNRFQERAMTIVDQSMIQTSPVKVEVKEEDENFKSSV